MKIRFTSLLFFGVQPSFPSLDVIESKCPSVFLDGVTYLGTSALSRKNDCSDRAKPHTFKYTIMEIHRTLLIIARIVPAKKEYSSGQCKSVIEVCQTALYEQLCTSVYSMCFPFFHIMHRRHNRAIQNSQLSLP